MTIYKYLTLDRIRSSQLNIKDSLLTKNVFTPYLTSPYWRSCFLFHSHWYMTLTFTSSIFHKMLFSILHLRNWNIKNYLGKHIMYFQISPLSAFSPAHFEFTHFQLNYLRCSFRGLRTCVSKHFKFGSKVNANDM